MISLCCWFSRPVIWHWASLQEDRLTFNLWETFSPTEQFARGLKLWKSREGKWTKPTRFCLLLVEKEKGVRAQSWVSYYLRGFFCSAGKGIRLDSVVESRRSGSLQSNRYLLWGVFLSHLAMSDTSVSLITINTGLTLFYWYISL